MEVVENACRLPCRGKSLARPMILFQNPNKVSGCRSLRFSFYFGAFTE